MPFWRETVSKRIKKMRFLFKKKPLNQNDIVSIYFRVDADKKIGLGHLSRCRSLMLGFLNFTGCRFSIESNNKEVVKKFISHFDFDLYDVGHSFKEELFDIVIIDLFNIRAQEKKHLESLSGLIVCIDDEGPGLSGQDVLIRPNLLNLPKVSKITSHYYWSGRDYIILHPDFAHQAHKKKNRSGKVKQLLVCFGGSDPGGLNLRVMSLLKKLKNCMKVHVVLGAEFSEGRKIASILKHDSRFLISHNISNMAQVLGNVDLALISGGTLVYEACSLGIPSVVISQNASQETESKICQAAGAVVSLGVNEAVSDDQISAALQELIEDDSLRQKLASNGPKIVSPNGTMRIVSKLLSYVKGDVFP